MADKRTILTLEIIEEPTAFGAPILQFRMGYDDADAGSVRAAGSACATVVAFPASSPD